MASTYIGRNSVWLPDKRIDEYEISESLPFIFARVNIHLLATASSYYTSEQYS